MGGEYESDLRSNGYYVSSSDNKAWKKDEKKFIPLQAFFFSFPLALIFTTAQLVFITAKIAFIFTISALFESCSQILRKRSGVYTLCICLYLV